MAAVTTELHHPHHVPSTFSRVLRVVEVQARTYRRTWRGSAFSTVVTPVLYLAAMGIGLGTLVDRGAGQADLDGLRYLDFLAPGLLAAATMQTGAGEGAWPVMAGIKWRQTYQATLATPVGVTDLVAGHLVWLTVRATITASVFALVAIVLGAASPAGGLAAIPPAVLTGIAFGAAVTGFTARLESENGLTSLFRFGIVPMFLFSGTFFPIEQLPDVIRPLALVTPLWHGVELTRAMAIGTSLRLPPWLHVAYLLLLAVVGARVAVHHFRRRLLP